MNNDEKDALLFCLAISLLALGVFAGVSALVSFLLK